MSFSERQLEIIESSMQLIMEHGLDGLTTKKIARSIGLTEAALYRHFTGKTDILVGILSYFEEKAIGILEEAKKLKMSDLDKIHWILKKRSESFSENPATMVVILSEELFPNNSDLSKKVGGIMKQNQETIQSILISGREKGEIRTDIPPEQLFLTVIGSFRLMVTRWRLNNFSFDLPEEFEKLWSGLTKMIKNH